MNFCLPRHTKASIDDYALRGMTIFVPANNTQSLNPCHYCSSGLFLYKPRMSALRQHLKLSTERSHNRIDARLGGLDLTSVQGLSDLLSTHHLVQSAYRSVADAHFLTEIEADLAALQCPVPTWREPPQDLDYDPLGFRYVMAGSQLGARILYRAWVLSEDRTVKSASHFMTANLEGQDWKQLMAWMKTTSIESIELDRVVRSANRVFEIYDLAATEVGVPVGASE